MNDRRIRLLKGKDTNYKGPIAYWMSRDQRANDNWALLFAQQLALEKKKSLLVLFCIVPRFLGATYRQYSFMLKGLQQVARTLEQKQIPFYLLQGQPGSEIPKFVKAHSINTLITDFDPLRIKLRWKKQVADKIEVPLFEVDAHNIIPCWSASAKQEYSAYTFRPKIHRLLPEFLEQFDNLQKHPFKYRGTAKKILPDQLIKTLKVDTTVSEVDWIKPGEKAARKMLDDFIRHKLNRYNDNRNDPNKNGQSNLSPYIHFGQISAQRVALEVKKAKVNAKAKEAFLEELIVRRELSDNFCFYNRNYDSVNGFPEWAKKTLKKHKKDKRQYTYSLKPLEKAQTHDDLWNAAQMEMVRRGKMHGYMRMYWAKKILEWTESAEQAMKIAVYLNDKYELDGRDPNGYVGIAWSIGGVHDRAWGQRSVFGNIRYMSYNGCESKFDVEKYISTFL